VRSPGGRAFGLPDETFGEIALVTNQPRTATIRAQTDLEVYSRARDEFDRLANARPAFGEQVRNQVELLLTEASLKKASPFAQRHTVADARGRRLLRRGRPAGGRTP
jgi:CRP-like cAMP-binding protein